MLIVVTNVLTGANTPIFGGAKPVPFNPANIRNEWGVALIAISGPLVNLVLAFIAFGIWVYSGVGTDTFMGVLLQIAVWVNLGFFAFNIIPLPPLDGSRVLYALAPDFIRQIMEMIERYGVFLVFAIVLLFNNLLFEYMNTVIQWMITGFSYVLGII